MSRQGFQVHRANLRRAPAFDPLRRALAACIAEPHAPHHHLQRPSLCRHGPSPGRRASGRGDRPAAARHRRPAGAGCRPGQDRRSGSGPPDRPSTKDGLPLPPRPAGRGGALWRRDPHHLSRAPDPDRPPARSPGHPRLEPRGAVWLAAEIDGKPVQIINTHLGLVPKEQQIQAAWLAGPSWLGHPMREGPSILLGDFNATGSSVVYRTLCAKLAAARRLALNKSPTSTFPRPCRCCASTTSSSARRSRCRTSSPLRSLTRIASDHLPLVMDFSVA